MSAVLWFVGGAAAAIAACYAAILYLILKDHPFG